MTTDLPPVPSAPKRGRLVAVLLLLGVGGHLFYQLDGWMPWTIAPGLLPDRLRTRTSCACTRRSIAVGHDNYPRHVRAAKAWPKARVAAERELEAALQDSVLVPFGNSPGRRIATLTHSHDLLHPGPAAVFHELERRFAEAVRGTPEADTRMVVSSLYRTTAQQKQLAGVNRSATRGRSSHSYGASIDVRELETTGDCGRALKKFEEVLKAMRKERRLLVIREGACLHLTAWR